MIFSFMTAQQNTMSPGTLYKGEAGGVSLYLDIGWTKTDNGYFKGFDFGNKKGNYTQIEKTHTGWSISFDDYRTQGITSNSLSLLSNHPVHRNTDNLQIDTDFLIDNSELKHIQYPKEPIDFEQNLSLEEVSSTISDLIKTYLENVLEISKKPLIVYFSGGLDTGAIVSVINKYNLPIEVKTDTVGKVILNNSDTRSPNFSYFATSKAKQFPSFSYNQVPIEEQNVLVSGHYGGIEMLRFPQHVKSIFKHYNLDYNSELQKCKGSYLYNFLQCADHNCDTTYPASNFDTLSETKNWIIDIIKYNMEIQSIENCEYVFPWRQLEIPKLMLNLNFETFKEHVFHSTVHKKIIEMNDKKIINFIPKEKEKEIW